ncbi:MAG: S8 family serine peptidase, partial [Planctomycetota bacterium]
VHTHKYNGKIERPKVISEAISGAEIDLLLGCAGLEHASNELRARVAAALTAALRWLTAQPVHIVNLSLSTPRPDWGLRISQQIDALCGQGVLVTASAGPPDAPHDYPARLGAVVGIDAQPGPAGALRAIDGPIDLLASGVDAPAAWKHNTTRRAVGSSYACPIVAGLAARLLETEPALRPFDVRSLLRRYAQRYGQGWRPAWIDQLDAPRPAPQPATPPPANA